MFPIETKKIWSTFHKISFPKTYINFGSKRDGDEFYVEGDKISFVPTAFSDKNILAVQVSIITQVHLIMSLFVMYIGIYWKNYPAKILPRNLLGAMLQKDVSLAKCK